ncbi:MAG TPA: YbhB/YbcL family Raf kinase inhibitor-like protein [Candidatus Paceibacterota bacterium]|nr:YbhB/YbcL family Raf kinase inhibitor-like protein [Candidatus Paceibacterota bacterium]
METNFKLFSSAFEDGEVIPEKYTCRGEGINPSLEISGVPEGTKSLVLIMHDPDAPSGDFLHWTIWNISQNTMKIPENSVPDNAKEGCTDFGKSGYGGPCPPSGVHHYIFELSALDAKLDLPAGATRAELEKAIAAHIITKTVLTGTVSTK